jgi:hypothetical protein
MGPGSFPGVKRPVRGVNNPPLSSVEVQERVELYVFFSSFLPSWQPTGRNWCCPFRLKCVWRHSNVCMDDRRLWSVTLPSAKEMRAERQRRNTGQEIWTPDAVVSDVAGGFITFSGFVNSCSSHVGSSKPVHNIHSNNCTSLQDNSI